MNFIKDHNLIKNKIIDIDINGSTNIESYLKEELNSGDIVELKNYILESQSVFDKKDFNVKTMNKSLDGNYLTVCANSIYVYIKDGGEDIGFLA